MILPNSVCGKSPQRSFALFQIKLASVDSVLFGAEAILFFNLILQKLNIMQLMQIFQPYNANFEID